MIYIHINLYTTILMKLVCVGVLRSPNYSSHFVSYCLPIFVYLLLFLNLFSLLIGAVNKESTVLQPKFFNNYNRQSAEEATSKEV